MLLFPSLFFSSFFAHMLLLFIEILHESRIMQSSTASNCVQYNNNPTDSHN